jgi:hypothetical protein
MEAIWQADMIALSVLIIGALTCYVIKLLFLRDTRSAKDVITDDLRQQWELDHRMRMTLLDAVKDFTASRNWRVMAIKTDKQEAFMRRESNGFNVLCTLICLPSMELMYTLRGERVNDRGTALTTLPAPYTLDAVEQATERLAADTRKVTEALLLTPTFSDN